MAAAVLGDFIYLDGGEVSQDGRDFRLTDTSAYLLSNYLERNVRRWLTVRIVTTVNSTLSIDCTSSWTPSDVEIREVSRPQNMPVLAHQNLFTDLSTNSFYVWGGYTPWDESVDTSFLWRFIVDGGGGGEWVREAPGNPDFFVALARSNSGAYTQTPDTGYVFGGSELGSNARETGANVKGVVTFDFDSKDWAQDTNGPFSPDGSLWGATATYVNKFTEKGLIVILGGVTRRAETASGYLAFNTVQLYDVTSGTWYEQETTGDAPSRRSHHCAVGVGDSESQDTYEM